MSAAYVERFFGYLASERDVAMLARSATQGLLSHLDVVPALHLEHLAAGFGGVYLPHALDHKYSNAGREWGWRSVASPLDGLMRAAPGEWKVEEPRSAYGSTSSELVVANCDYKPEVFKIAICNLKERAWSVLQALAAGFHSETSAT